MWGEIARAVIAAVQSKNTFDALLEQLHLKLWRFHLASAAFILYFCAVLGKKFHERVKAEGTGSSHIFRPFKAVHLPMACLVRNSKEKILNTQKSEICLKYLSMKINQILVRTLPKKRGISPYLHPTFKNPIKHFNTDWIPGLTMTVLGINC